MIKFHQLPSNTGVLSGNSPTFIGIDVDGYTMQLGYCNIVVLNGEYGHKTPIWYGNQSEAERKIQSILDILNKEEE